jgi:predicted phosphodiesterase
MINKHILRFVIVIIVAPAILGSCVKQPYRPTQVSLATPAKSPSAAQPTITTQPTPTIDPAYQKLTEADVKVFVPYLQQVTTDSIIIAWDTDEPTKGKVVYSKNNDSDLVKISSKKQNHHAIKLTDLEPYTRYHYRVFNESGPVSGERTFRTAASPGQSKFDFVVYGDTHFANEHHRLIVERALALGPDFALHVGDLVHRGLVPILWNDFFEVEQDLLAQVPMFPTLGNHDRDSQYYFDLFYLPGNERYYGFNYGNAYFICLEVDGELDFSPGSEQYIWLEKTLKTNTQSWILIYFHIPPYAAPGESSEELAIRKALTPLFEKYNVDVVFCGHHHEYQRMEVNGVTYIITGGGGGRLGDDNAMPDDELLDFYFNDYHLVHVTITGDALIAKAITATGKEFDQFALTKP